MVGALIKATECISMGVLKEDFERRFLGKFGRQVVDSNLRAIDRAYEEIQAS